MRTHHILTLAAVAAMTVAVPAVPAGQQRRAAYTLDDWMTMTSVGSFNWSPDGATIYYTSDVGDSGTDENVQDRDGRWQADADQHQPGRAACRAEGRD